MPTDLDPQPSLMGNSKPPHLKLVVSNPHPGQWQPPSHQEGKPSQGFTAEIRKASPLHYSLVASDNFHCLACELMMEIVYGVDEDNLDPVSVACQFPPMVDGKLNALVNWDETLLGMIMVDFQMKILEHLLLFCATKNAPILVIRVDDTSEGDPLGVYREVAVYEDKIRGTKGGLIQLTLPTDTQTFDRWVDLMGEAKDKFSQALWQEQATNSAIRQYLKSLTSYHATKPSN